MNKIKFLKIAVIVLLIINLPLLILFIMAPHGHRDNVEAKRIIIEKLKLDNEQKKQYELLINDHKKNINDADGNIRKLKNQLYETLAANNYSKKDSLINEINLYQRKIENINYQHFLDIKKICKPEQIPYFNKLTSELAKLFEGNQEKIRHKTKE